MNPTYLIIGGTTKSGTTSLFKYLGDHPDVCASSMKETRFFLDSDYPLESKYRLEDGIDKYNQFFTHRNGECILMEATPDYLYSLQTAAKVKKTLSPVKIIFILREPAARFISWFNFSKQIGQLSPDAGIEHYMSVQQLGEDNAMAEQHLMALRQGNYSGYLKRFYEHFDDMDIHICFFEDLATNPQLMMNSLCAFLHIDYGFYKTYNFQKHNTTIGLRNQLLHKQYITLSYKIRKFTHNKKIIHNTLKWIKRIIHPVYVRLNKKHDKGLAVSQEAQMILEQFYARESQYYKERYRSFYIQKKEL